MFVLGTVWYGVYSSGGGGRAAGVLILLLALALLSLSKHPFRDFVAGGAGAYSSGACHVPFDRLPRIPFETKRRSYS